MPPKTPTAAETRVYKGTTSVNGKSYWRHPSRPWVVVRGKVPGLYALLNGIFIELLLLHVITYLKDKLALAVLFH
jgi:hypothetical protein